MRTVAEVSATWLLVLGLSGCGRLYFEGLLLPGDAASDANADSGLPDATTDATAVDANTQDASTTDAARIDASNPDANGIGIDASNPDANGIDASVTDANGIDASGQDAAGSIDASAQDAALMIDAAPPGPTCNDGIQNGTETGIDCGGSNCSACSPTGNNTPPVPVIHVTPGVGFFDTGTPTAFMATASGTWDIEDPPSALFYEWDWNNDGVFDPADRGTTPPSHVYNAPGNYTLVLRVTDTGGLRGYGHYLLVVRAAVDVITVLSDSDPLPIVGPGPTLRQAMAQANTTAGRQSIYIPAGTVIQLANVMLDSSDAAGLDVVGDGAVIDGTNLNGTIRCLNIISSNNFHLGLEIKNCPGGAYNVTGSNNTFGRGYVHDNGSPVNLAGSSNTFGPGNLVSRNTPDGIIVQGPNAVEFSTFTNHTGSGIELGSTSDGTRVLGNTCYDNSFGIRLTSGANDNTLLHNTLVANYSGHLSLVNGLSGEILRNNLLAHGPSWGMVGWSASFTTFGPNLFFNNAGGDCSNCPNGLGAGSVTTDPLLINLTTHDYRLLPMSPAINAGVDTGFDINGPAAGSGNYNGVAPDLGASESPS